jgi:hypothetical protein
LREDHRLRLIEKRVLGQKGEVTGVGGDSIRSSFMICTPNIFRVNR